MPDEGEKALPLLHNFQTNKNKMKLQKPRDDEENKEGPLTPGRKTQKDKKKNRGSLDDEDLLDLDSLSSNSDLSSASEGENVVKISKPVPPPILAVIAKKPVAADDLDYLDDLLESDDELKGGNDSDTPLKDKIAAKLHH